MAYWDLNADREIKILDKELKSISYFAASFNSNNKLVMPEELASYYNKTKSYDYSKFITIVNDKINIDGSASLKDTDLLKALLSNGDLVNQEEKQILNLLGI